MPEVIANGTDRLPPLGEQREKRIDHRDVDEKSSSRHHQGSHLDLGSARTHLHTTSLAVYPCPVKRGDLK